MSPVPWRLPIFQPLNWEGNWPGRTVFKAPLTWDHMCRIQAEAKFSPCFLAKLCVHPDEAPSKLYKGACPGGRQGGGPEGRLPMHLPQEKGWGCPAWV